MIVRSLMILAAVFLTGLQGHASFIEGKTQTFKLQTDQSSVQWFGEKYSIVDAGSKHQGTIKLKSGELTVKDGKITGGKFVADMTSIKNTDLKDAKWNKKLVGHLKSPDFFDVSKHPEASFEIKSVKHKEGNTKTVSGTMSIRGKKQPETFTLDVAKIGKTYKATGKITLDRKKYGVSYNSEADFLKKAISVPKDKVIKDKMVLNLDLIAKAS